MRKRSAAPIVPETTLKGNSVKRRRATQRKVRAFEWLGVGIIEGSKRFYDAVLVNGHKFVVGDYAMLAIGKDDKDAKLVRIPVLCNITPFSLFKSYVT